VDHLAGCVLGQSFCCVSDEVTFHLFSFAQVKFFFNLFRVPGICKTKQRVLYWDELLFLLLPLSMFLLGSFDIASAVIMWLFIVACSSFMYRVIAVNSGHHSPEIIHEGDELRSLDFGIFQMGATVDRIEGSKTQFMILTLFGEHTLHHLFPTLDQGLLPQLHEILVATCKEFEMEFRKFSWFHLFVGQFKELARIEPSSLC
jgi:fatty acid desaturase